MALQRRRRINDLALFVAVGVGVIMGASLMWA